MSEYDLIAIRKETKEYTKRTLYPLSNVVSFKNFHHPIGGFFVCLNNIFILTNIFEALFKENWRQTMDAKMEALEKNKV